MSLKKEKIDPTFSRMVGKTSLNWWNLNLDFREVKEGAMQICRKDVFSAEGIWARNQLYVFDKEWRSNLMALLKDTLSQTKIHDFRGLDPWCTCTVITEHLISRISWEIQFLWYLNISIDALLWKTAVLYIMNNSFYTS
jgi:hypothetical protein